jgi:RhoGAP domain
MSVEGIFRKNGNIRRLKELADALDRDQSSVNLQDDNPVQLAALLKKFLRDLPEPLCTFKLHHLIIATQRAFFSSGRWDESWLAAPDDCCFHTFLKKGMEPLERRKKVLHLVCCLLPKPHRDTLEVLFVFLKWTASFSHVDEETGSKMDLQNLATVICPNILYSKAADPTRDESFQAIRAVLELLEHQDEFWQVPPDLEAILHDQELFSNPSELTSKAILKRAEGYVRARRANPETSRRAEVHAHQPNYHGQSSPDEGQLRPISWSSNPSDPMLRTQSSGYFAPRLVSARADPNVSPHRRPEASHIPGPVPVEQRSG